MLAPRVHRDNIEFFFLALGVVLAFEVDRENKESKLSELHILGARVSGRYFEGWERDFFFALRPLCSSFVFLASSRAGASGLYTERQE